MPLEVVMRDEIAAALASNVVLAIGLCGDDAGAMRGVLLLARAQAMTHRCWGDVCRQVQAVCAGTYGDVLALLEG